MGCEWPGSCKMIDQTRTSYLTILYQSTLKNLLGSYSFYDLHWPQEYITFLTKQRNSFLALSAYRVLIWPQTKADLGGVFHRILFWIIGIQTVRFSAGSAIKNNGHGVILVSGSKYIQNLKLAVAVYLPLTGTVPLWKSLNGADGRFDAQLWWVWKTTQG